MKYSIALLLSILFIVPNLNAQDQPLAIGQWRSHLPYTFAVSVTEAGDQVYFASKEALVSIDKTDFSTNLLNKVNGLTDAGIETIRYNPEDSTLVIAYLNSNIDLVKNGKIINVNGIREDDGITGDRSINHIFFDGTDMYLSTGFGLTKYDLKAREFRYTTFTDFAINATQIFNEKLFLSTDEGVYSININNPDIVLKDFNNWTLNNTNGLPMAYYSNALQTLNGKLYADVNDSLFVYNGNNWSKIFHVQNYGINKINPGKDRLIIASKCACADRIHVVEESGAYFPISNLALVGETGEAIEDAEGNIWIADEFQGMGRYKPDNTFDEFIINGPFSNSIGEISIVNNELWMAAVNNRPTWGLQTKSDGFSSYINGEWTIYRHEEFPEFTGFWDITTIAVNPVNNHVFAGSFRKGLIEFYDNTVVNIYNETNSTLDHPLLDPNTTRISGLTFDNENNLWVSNYEALDPVSVLTPDGSWYAFGSGGGIGQATQIVIDRNNYKWIAGGNSDGGIMVFDHGASIEDPSDDRYVVLRSNNSAMESNKVRSLALDLDGNVWAGTTEGPVVFECTGLIFQNSCPGRRPIAREGEFDDYLLGNEFINTIAIDGANRKWFGTNNGVLVLTPDGTEEVLNFNTSNSPLYSDEIVDIAINGETGEVFIGTGLGVISYKSDATAGGVIFSDEVFAYPNPVRPNYEGPIAIKGLTTDANVKITDIAGELVYETKALGGQAIWDGRDYNGRKANSGVYLVFLNSKDGTKKMVTKILLMN